MVFFFNLGIIFILLCSIVISPFPLPFLLSLTIAFKLIIVGNITRGKDGEDIQLFSLSFSLSVPGAVFSAGSLFSLRLQLLC